MIGILRSVGLGSRAAVLAGATMVAAGGGSVFCEKSGFGGNATEMLTCGLNLIGQLGNGHDRPIAVPSKVPALDGQNLVSVSLGDNASAAITNDGILYTWGSGAYGRLGHGDESSLNLPRANEQLVSKKIVDVALGGFHMVALDEEGKVYTWGRGTAAGQDSYESVLNPTQLGGAIANIKVKAIAAGRLHCAAVGEDGSLWTWGNNFEGALGQGDKATRYQPTRVASLGGLKALNVACGRDFTVVLLEDGTLYSFGADDYGQLGQGRGHGERYVQVPKKVIGGLADVTQIAAGDYHTCALTNTGTVFTWGIGREGQLGHGEKSDQAIPKPVEALGNEKMRQVCCGGGHTGAVTEGNDLYLWGRGRDGQLARGSALESIAAYRLTPQKVESVPPSSVLQVSLGADHTALLLRQGEGN